MSMYFLNVEIFCPLTTERVEKLIYYIHGNLRNINSCKRLTGAAANSFSSLLITELSKK